MSDSGLKKEQNIPNSTSTSRKYSTNQPHRYKKPTQAHPSTDADNSTRIYRRSPPPPTNLHTTRASTAETFNHRNTSNAAVRKLTSSIPSSIKSTPSNSISKPNSSFNTQPRVYNKPSDLSITSVPMDVIDTLNSMGAKELSSLNLPPTSFPNHERTSVPIPLSPEILILPAPKEGNSTKPIICTRV